MVKIVKKIPVKQVLTEKSKIDMEQQFQKQISQLDKECQQLSFEKRKIAAKNNASKEQVFKRFKRELDQRNEKIKWLQFKLEQLTILPLGTEITQEEIDTIVEINEGDSWDELMSEGSIVVEDGIVIRIDG